METPIKYINKLKSQRIKLEGQMSTIQARIDVIDKEVEEYNNKMQSVQCIECKSSIGARKHHEFKNGKVCHACFISCVGKFKEWNS